MIKTLNLLMCLALFGLVSAVAADAPKGYYFYSPEDLANVKKSAQTDWGKGIVESLKNNVAQRRKFELKPIAQKTGRYHSYFCSVHATLFEFDWNSPREHLCKACGKKYPGLYDSWLYQGHYKNADYLTDCMWVYMATGEKKYAEYIRDMFLDYAEIYPQLPEYDAETVKKKYHLGRLFDQFLDESAWFTKICRAYLAVKETLTPEEIEKIETGLFRNGANLLMNRQGGNNWQVWNNSGRIMLGVILQDDEIIDTALNAKQGYINIVKNEINDDGWYNEASAGYHFYPLQAFMHTANAALCRGVNLFDERFYNAFAGVAKGVYPDMKFLAHNDGWYGISVVGNADLYEFAYVRYGKDEALREVLAAAYGGGKRTVPEALLSGEDIQPSKASPKLPSFVFNDTGFGLLRDGKNTVSLVWGQGEGGHQHPHKLSITIHNGKKEIISDMGTCGYGLPAYRKWYQKSLAHSTVSADFQNQLLRVEYGDPLPDGRMRWKKVPGELAEFTPKPDGGILEAIASKPYADIAMKRRLELKRGILKDVFECASENGHTYEYVLMFLEKPQINAKGEDAVFDESEAHTQVKNVKKHKVGKKFKIKSDSAEVEIENVLGNSAEVFIGEALGPVVSAYEGQGQTDQKSYPVVVRIKGKNLKINSTWSIR